MGGALPRPAQRLRHRPVCAAALRAAAPRRLGLRQGQRRSGSSAKFKEWGVAADIETFDVLFPTPKERAVELVEPTQFTAKLQEPTVPGDPTSGQHDEQLPTYNAYSIDGDVTAPLVYVNYGVPEDYEQLDRLGVSVKGAIVIARYGGSWRGIKPKVAAEHGAVGCIIYSDPRDDGYFMGEVFPQGAWPQPRRRAARQRHGHAGLSRRSADARASARPPNAKRLELKEAHDPHEDPGAADLLWRCAAAAGGARRAASRRRAGAARCRSPITSVPGPAKVHLKVKSNWDIKTDLRRDRQDPGPRIPDEWIVRGNHHDAWVNGADDPVSGAGALLEEARALRRAAEAGLEAEAHHRLLRLGRRGGGAAGLDRMGRGARRRAAAARRRLHQQRRQRPRLSGHGGLALAGEIHQRRGARHRRSGKEHHASGSATSCIASPRPPRRRRAQEIRTRPDLRIEALGSGSDYTAFVDHLGIASLNLGFGGEDGGGIYHSIYDDYYWYTHFSDGDFVYGRALAQTIGTRGAAPGRRGCAAVRFHATWPRPSSATWTNCRSSGRAPATASASAIAKSKKDVFGATSDPRRPLQPPPAETVPPFLNFAPLENGAAALTPQRRALREGARQGDAWRAANLAPAQSEADSDGARADGSRKDCRGVPGSSTSSTRRASIPATA